MTSKGKLFVTQGFPVPEAIPELPDVLSWAGTSKSIGCQLLWWESLASSLDRKHQFGIVSGMFKAPHQLLHQAVNWG